MTITLEKTCGGPDCSKLVTSKHHAAIYCSPYCARRGQIARNPEYYEGHKEERKQYLREYYQANKSTKKERDRKYVRANRDRIAAYQADWRDANRARIAANRREWLAANRDRTRQNTRNWKAKNPEIVTLQNRARRHLKRETPISRDALAARRAFLGDTCWICHRHALKLTWDHVKPLSKGGAHMLSNLRLACVSCNSRKGAKWSGVPGLPSLLGEITAGLNVNKGVQAAYNGYGGRR